MAEFTIDGVAYRSGPMDGETLTLVAKRLLPTFAALMGLKPELTAGAAAVATEAEVDAADRGEGVRATLLPVARELAGLGDADLTFILNACMDVTQRTAANTAGTTGARPVGVRQNGVVQNRDDARFKTRLTIAWHVLAENLADVLGSFGVDVGDLQAFATRAV